ncbi:MAG TPA: hypothetical protein VJN88_05530 [Ktedonobacterales bacterium]|nr:hypothetical protein [Ktedonobacterales bacterium]
MVEGSVIKRKINILLLGIPLVLFYGPLTTRFDSQLNGLGARRDTVVSAIIFVLAGLSLIPLAGFVESAVEELAELLGPFIGGLLHTTFGNVAELTIGLSLLLFGGASGPTIVLGSIAGVIIRNSLLGLGLATILGSLRNGKMKFNAENASEYSTVFALAVIGLSLPTIASMVFGGPNHERGATETHQLTILSLALAIVLVLSYIAYLAFAVFRVQEGYNLVEKRLLKRTAKKQARIERRERRRSPLFASQPDTQALFREEREQAEERFERGSAPVAVAEREPAAASPTPERKRIYAKAGKLEAKRAKREESGEEGILAGHRVLRGLIAALVLAVATAGVASMSEAFAKQVERLLGDNPQFKPYEFFLGLILIPVLAGIVELYGSIETARGNRMEITMAVTAGASIQMILLVVPILVIVGYIAGPAHTLALVFQPLHIIIFGASTFIYMLLSRDGESTWLEGAQLCTLWLLVAVTALFLHPSL